MSTWLGRVSDPRIEYQRATQNDFAELLKLVKSFTVELDGLLFSKADLLRCPEKDGRGHPVCHLNDSLLSVDSLVLTASVPGVGLVAFLKFDRGQTTKSRHRGSFSMAVKREYWGQGIGQELLRRLELWARAEGVTRIELSVLETNDRAVLLYRRAGYVFEGRKRRAAYVDGAYVDGFLMAKCLDGLAVQSGM